MQQNHKKKFQKVMQNFTTFRNTVYFRGFLRSCIWYFLPLLIWFLALICLSVTLSGFFPGGTVVLAFCLLVYLICGVFYWTDYYRSIIQNALKMETIKKKFDLTDADKMVDFDSALGVILDLTDTTLEREYSSRLLQKQAEYDAMRSQINPHFLYNTLDTIRGYAVIEDAPITGDMIELLSRLFRYTVSQKNVLVPLHREISILNDYIKIQEYRINQHIIYVQKIDPDLDIMDYRIPRLIVQPFIENAVKHGMRGIRRDFIITLSIYRTQSRLVISVADNGCGMTAKQLQQLNERLAGGESEASQSDSDTMKKAGSGIALTNVNARIRLIYGSDYGVTAFSSPGDGAEFQIALPYLAAERSS